MATPKPVETMYSFIQLLPSHGSFVSYLCHLPVPSLLLSPKTDCAVLPS